VVAAVKKMSKKAINFIVDFEEDYGQISRQNNILAQIGEINHNLDEQNLDDMLLSEDNNDFFEPSKKP